MRSRWTWVLLTPLLWATTSSGNAVGADGARTPADASIEGELTVLNYFKTPEQVEALDEMAALFNEVFPNVDVVNETIAFEQLTSKLLADAAAGRGPDVIIYQWGDIVKLAEVGALATLDPYFDSWSDAATIPAAVQHRVTDTTYDPEGELLTIQPYTNLIGIYYNEDILDDVGIEAPQTLDEFEAALEAVTAAGYKGVVMDWRPGVGGWWGAMPFMFANGVDASMDAADRDTIEQLLAMGRRWIEEGYAPPDVVTFDQQTALVQWLSGEYAFTVNGNWELNRVLEEATFPWGTTTMPDGTNPSSVYLGGEGLAIGAFADAPDLAWEYLQLSWLSARGQSDLIGSIGSIPVRTDVADAPEIAETVGAGAFVEQVATGTRLPVTQAENEAQTLFGDTWSAVVSGQLSPEEGAERIVNETATILAR